MHPKSHELLEYEEISKVMWDVIAILVVYDNYINQGKVCGDDEDTINGMPTGVIWVSFGKESTWEDMDVLLTFLQTFVEKSPRISHPPTAPPLPKSAHAPPRICEIYIYIRLRAVPPCAYLDGK